MSTASPSSPQLPPSAPQQLRAVDRDLMILLRGGDALGVGELTEALGVTATAVRQRIERLLAMGLIEREKVVAGRGRPTYRYRLTDAGQQRAGADVAELAEAMWRAIVAIEDPQVRDGVVTAVAARLGRQFAEQLQQHAGAAGVAGRSDAAFAERLEQLSEMLLARQVSTEVSWSGDLPVLDVTSCPYPSLTEASEDRAMCRLEEKMLSEALGRPVQLNSCRLDGDDCCQFAPVGADGLDDAG